MVLLLKTPTKSEKNLFEKFKGKIKIEPQHMEGILHHSIKLQIHVVSNRVGKFILKKENIATGSLKIWETKFGSKRYGKMNDFLIIKQIKKP